MRGFLPASIVANRCEAFLELIELVGLIQLEGVYKPKDARPKGEF
jgi:hypothetical protein